MAIIKGHTRGPRTTSKPGSGGHGDGGGAGGGPVTGCIVSPIGGPGAG